MNDIIFQKIKYYEKEISPYIIDGNYNDAIRILYTLNLLNKDKYGYVDNWLTDYFIGEIYQRSGRITDAKEKLVFVFKNCEIPEIKSLSKYTLGKVFSQKGDFKNALKLFKNIHSDNSGRAFRGIDHVGRIQLPLLWRMGLLNLGISDKKSSEYFFSLHDELCSLVPYQEANKLSCKTLSCIINDGNSFDNYRSSVSEVRELYFGSSGLKASEFLWQRRAIFSTFLTDATIDYRIGNKFDAYFKLLIVRRFLQESNLTSRTEGIGELIVTLSYVFPEISPIMNILDEEKFYNWVRKHAYAKSIAIAYGKAIEVYEEYKHADFNLNNSIIEDGVNSNLKPKRKYGSIKMPKNPKKIFIIHGHSVKMKNEVQLFLARADLDDCVLHECPDRGRTIIDKLIEESKSAAFALALLSPDDETSSGEKRARQNVILEIGYFLGRLGKSRVRILKKGNIDIPSDLHGVLYINFDDEGAWKIKLIKEMEDAGITVNSTKVVSKF